MPATDGVVLVSLSQADILPSGTHGNITIAYDQPDSGSAWENLQLNNPCGQQYLVIINKGPTKMEGKADLVFHESIGSVLSELYRE